MRYILLPAFFLAAAVASAFATDIPSENQKAQSANPPSILTLDANRSNPYDIRLTLYWENDGNFAKAWDSHDRHYTAGAGTALSWRAPWVDDLLQNVPSWGGEFSRNTDYAMGLVGALTMYTPEDIAAFGPIASDRPFAGYTYAGLFAQRARRVPGPEFGFAPAAGLADPTAYSSFESLELDVGILGPSSLAQNAQELIHHTFDYTYPNGWGNQIQDEPEFSLKYNRRWRSQAIRPFESLPIAYQVIPEVGVIAGSLQDELRAGATFRLGYRLPDDFGPGELANPADFTGEAACACPGLWDNFLRNQSVYIFARPTGRLVAHNALLQGDNWRHDDPVTVNPRPAIFAGQFGLAWRFLKHFEVAYVTTYETPEFSGQKGWDSWSSVQASFSLAW